MKDDEKSCIIRILCHYSQRLSDLKNHDDIKNGNSILKRDLDENSKNAKDLSENFRADFNYLINTDIGKIICLAARCYVYDLQNSQKKARELLGGINTDFKNTKSEMDMANKIKSIIGCNNISFAEDKEDISTFGTL